MDLGLSPQKTSEILNDFEEDKDDFTRAFMIYWRDQIGILYESEFILEMTIQECYDLLELDNKKFVVALKLKLSSNHNFINFQEISKHFYDGISHAKD